jgi:phosphoribosylaminoimidazole synthetase
MATYKDAGVNIEATNAMVEDIVTYSNKTSRPGQISNIGGFAGIFDLKKCGYSDPLLVTSTDGVGTKILLGIETGLLDGLGFDLVGMCLNDTVCHGADPLFFLDYYASSKIDKSSFIKIVKSIVLACKENECLLIGGETAEMPGVYRSNDFDLAGFCVGAVERQGLLPQKNIMNEGDILIGITSSGFHSNGYSLVRKVLKDNSCDLNGKTPFDSNWKTLGEAVMEPTKLYHSILKPFVEKNIIKGMAHITGGGIIGNVPRMLPDNLGADINKSFLPKNNLFDWFQDLARMKEQDMFNTFNCGMGMILVIDNKEKNNFFELVNGDKDFFEIGSLTSSSQSNYCSIS